MNRQEVNPAATGEFPCLIYMRLQRVSDLAQPVNRCKPATELRRSHQRRKLAGMSLSDYLLSEIREVAEWPTVEELRARLEQRSPVMPSIRPVDAVRTERDRNDRR